MIATCHTWTLHLQPIPVPAESLHSKPMGRAADLDLNSHRTCCSTAPVCLVHCCPSPGLSRWCCWVRTCRCTCRLGWCRSRSQSWCLSSHLHCPSRHSGPTEGIFLFICHTCTHLILFSCIDICGRIFLGGRVMIMCLIFIWVNILLFIYINPRFLNLQLLFWYWIILRNILQLIRLYPINPQPTYL